MVELDADVMKVIQEGIGNWDPRMAQVNHTGGYRQLGSAYGAGKSYRRVSATGIRVRRR